MSHKEELLTRLADKEDNFVERKLEGYGARDFRKTIVAFANSVPENRKAVLFVGVRDDGTVQGVTDADSLQKKLGRIWDKDCYPPIRPHPVCTCLRVSDKDIVAVEVTASKNRPHFSGPAYIRRASENVPASEELFRDMLTSHCDKAAAIVKLKHSMVTVELIGKKLGSHRAGSGYHAEPECFILDCTPHCVTFEHAGGRYSEPLENITLAEDTKRHRPYKLIIRAPS